MRNLLTFLIQHVDSPEDLEENRDTSQSNNLNIPTLPSQYPSLKASTLSSSSSQTSSTSLDPSPAKKGGSSPPSTTNPPLEHSPTAQNSPSENTFSLSLTTTMTNSDDEMDNSVSQMDNSVSQSQMDNSIQSQTLSLDESTGRPRGNSQIKYSRSTNFAEFLPSLPTVPSVLGDSQEETIDEFGVSSTSTTRPSSRGSILHVLE